MAIDMQKDPHRLVTAAKWKITLTASVLILDRSNSLLINTL